MDKVTLQLERLIAAGAYAGPDTQYGGITVGGAVAPGSANELTRLYCDWPEVTTIGGICNDLADDGLARACRLPNLRKIHLSGCRVTGNGLSAVGQVKQLEQLIACGIPNVDTAMPSISRNRSLRELEISRCELTDEGLSHLAEMPQLESLNLTGTSVQGGFNGFRASKGLKKLSVEDAPVDDEGAQAISRLYSLEELIVSNTRITDSGLQAIGSLKRLYWLTIDGTLVSSEGLSHLAMCPNLHKLWLSDSLLNQTGIQHLAVLPNLTDLLVIGNRYDRQLAERTESALPRCDVFWMMPDAPDKVK